MCTAEGSIGDVVKRVSCARIKTWPGEKEQSGIPVRGVSWSLLTTVPERKLRRL